MEGKKLIRGESLYTGWLANGKKNGSPTYKVNAESPGGDTGNLFDFPVTSAGLCNGYFNVCGNDDPTSKLRKNQDPDDMKNLYDNLVQAGDVSSLKFSYWRLSICRLETSGD